MVVNPVVALWMKQNAVICTGGPSLHTGDAIMKTPAREPGDPQITYETEAAL